MRPSGTVQPNRPTGGERFEAGQTVALTRDDGSNGRTPTAARAEESDRWELSSSQVPSQRFSTIASALTKRTL